MAESAPLVQTLRFTSPAAATAATVTNPAMEAPFVATVTGVTYTPQAAITGQNTNTRIIRLVNKGQAGAGSTLIASIQFDAGVNGVAFDERALTLTATTADRNVAEGDILSVESSPVGTGLADPGGLVQVTIERS